MSHTDLQAARAGRAASSVDVLNLRSWRRLAAAGVAAAVLAACGSVPSRGPDAEGGPAARDDARGASSSAARRGGGYYKDDGPGDDPPPDLDRVPDAQPRLEPLHRFANRPYNVFGRDYVPATALAPYRERGRASWYGRRFHGKPTSSGEPYDMYAMTAAHPTLPIPSYVRVTHLGNGRSVVVRVNDRGPFHKDRIIDLSYTAAHRLGYVNAGSATVDVEAILPGEVEMVEAAPVPPLPGRATAPRPSGGAVAPVEAAAAAAPGAAVTSAGAAGVFLQLGAFASQTNAEDFRSMVTQEMATLADRLELRRDGTRFRLQAGPYATVAEARAAAAEIASVLKLRPFVVTP